MELNNNSEDPMEHFMLNIPSDSMLYGKIDYDSMGIIGYSQGGAGAICAVTNYENGARYKARIAVSSFGVLNNRIVVVLALLVNSRQQ